MLEQASVSLTPPPAAGLEMAAAAVVEVDQPRPPEVTIARLQVWHNNRMTYWDMPIHLVWGAFAKMFCKVEKLDPDAVKWHAVCRNEMADPGRCDFSIPIDLDMTIEELGIEDWDTIWCTKKLHDPSSSAACSSRQQQPAASATSAEQPAASGSAEQPAAASSSNSEATARPPRPLRSRSPSAARVPKQLSKCKSGRPGLRMPPKARPEQKKEQTPVESKEPPRVFPGSTAGRRIVWPLEAEKIFFKMAMKLKETNMSGYTEEFEKKFVKELQIQEGQVALKLVPTIELRHAAVEEFLRAMGITPTKPPAPDFRSKQYR